MKNRAIFCFSLILGLVLFSYGTASAQDVVDAAKKAAEVTKDATVKTVKKTGEVAKDAAEGAKDLTVKGAKKTVEGSKKAYDKADDVAADSARATKKGVKSLANEGEYMTVSAWDGTKWVSKKVKKGTLKGVEKTEEGIEIIGEEAEEIID